MTVYESPSPATMRQPPEFTLYSDGHVIYTREVDDHGFDLRHAQLAQAGIDELTDAAAAVLRDAQESYHDIDLTDMSYTYFEIRTPDLNKVVSVYALGEWDDEAPSESDRALLAPLRERLLTFDAYVRNGNAVDLGAYEPERYLVELIDARDDMPDSNTITWPWPTLDVDDFTQSEPRHRTRVMTPTELDSVLPVANGDYLIATAPGGGRHVIYLTPLLPDEQKGMSL